MYHLLLIIVLFLVPYCNAGASSDITEKPIGFRIRDDESGCYLAFGPGIDPNVGNNDLNVGEYDVFYDCQQKGNLWTYKNNNLYAAELGWNGANELQWDYDANKGYAIWSNEHNAKVDTKYYSNDEIFQFNSDGTALYTFKSGSECVLQWSYTGNNNPKSSYRKWKAGGTVTVLGYEAKFDCTDLTPSTFTMTNDEQCSVAEVDIGAGSTIPMISGETNFYQTISYQNPRETQWQTTTMAQQKCITKQSRFQYTAGSKIGLSMTWGTEASVDIFSFASASASFELSVTAEVSLEFQSETTNSEEICQNIAAEEFMCPARTTCKRDFVVYSPSQQSFPISATVLCSITGNHVITGSFTAEGATGIVVADSQMPMDCPYYSEDYFDRGNGKLPFCDTCNSGTSCSVCRDGYVQMATEENNGIESKYECVTEQVCHESCGGKIKGDGYWEGCLSCTLPWQGAYCYEEDVNRPSCQAALQFARTTPGVPGWTFTVSNSFSDSFGKYQAIAIIIGVGIVFTLVIVIWCLIKKIGNKNEYDHVSSKDIEENDV